MKAGLKAVRGPHATRSEAAMQRLLEFGRAKIMPDYFSDALNRSACRLQGVSRKMGKIEHRIKDDESLCRDPQYCHLSAMKKKLCCACTYSVGEFFSYAWQCGTG